MSDNTAFVCCVSVCVIVKTESLCFSSKMADDDVYASFQPAAAPTWGGAAGTMSGATANPLGGRPPPSQWGGGVPGSQYGRPGGGADVRPMTSNRASGFSAQAILGQGNTFDPTNQARNLAMGPAPPLQKRADNSPEEQCMDLERRVNSLIEESSQHAAVGDVSMALEKAKDATKKERQLCKQREQLNLSDQINIDLSFSVMFNLAVQYHRSGLHTEALNTYSLLNKQFSAKDPQRYPQSARLRVNMGNIYAEQKKYMLANKMYRIALDVIPAEGKELQYKILRNIGNCFVKLGQYKDAMASYEQIMDGSPEIVTAFNLLLCYYALGDVDKLKRTFSRMLAIKVSGQGDDEDEDEEEKEVETKDVLVHDALRVEVRERRRQYLHYVTTSARLIGPVLDKDWRVGFDYVIEQLKHYELRDASSRLASELEMCKALNYLKYKKYREAIDGLKAFEKKDKALRARAATNLAYLYFLEGDYDSGEKYADMSVETHRYNAKALVNKGNFLYVRGDWEKARQVYQEAINVEADCVEGLYNYALSSKQLGSYEDALKVFKRLQSIIDSVEVMYQIADLYDIINDGHAIEWFNRLVGRVPTDPNVLARLGLLHAKEGDETQAFQFYFDAYRFYQVNMDVISWLGAFFVKNEVYDKAMQFFERASQIQPHEVKWQLMVASCYRRRGEYPQAKRIYEDVNRRHPENMECLRYLVHLCKDSGQIEDANEWFKKVKRLEAKLESEKQETSASAGTPGLGDTQRSSGSNPRDVATPTTPIAGAPQTRNREEKGRGPSSNAGGRKAQADDDDDDVDLPGA